MFLSVSPSGSSPTPPSPVPAGYTQLKCIIISPGDPLSTTPYFHDTLNYNALDTIEVKYKPIENMFSIVPSNAPVLFSSDIYRFIDFRNKTSSDPYYRFMDYLNIMTSEQHIQINVASDEYPVIDYELKSERDDLLHSHFYVNELEGEMNYSKDEALTDVYLGGMGDVPSFENRYALGSYCQLKITSYTDKKVVLHWIPALENVTNIAGFYDVINKKFIAPARGAVGYETL